MAELSTHPVDVLRRSLRPVRPVPPGAAAGLAALVSVRARYAALERDELAAIDAVLAAGGTWAHVAGVLGVGSRQAARQYGQRLRRRVKQDEREQHPPFTVPTSPASAGSVVERRQPRRTTRQQRRRSRGR